MFWRPWLRSSVRAVSMWSLPWFHCQFFSYTTGHYFSSCSQHYSPRCMKFQNISNSRNYYIVYYTTLLYLIACFYSIVFYSVVNLTTTLVHLTTQCPKTGYRWIWKDAEGSPHSVINVLSRHFAWCGWRYHKILWQDNQCLGQNSNLPSLECPSEALPLKPSCSDILLYSIPLYLSVLHYVVFFSVLFLCSTSFISVQYDLGKSFPKHDNTFCSAYVQHQPYKLCCGSQEIWQFPCVHCWVKCVRRVLLELLAVYMGGKNGGKREFCP
jgi:hypothetical protein